MFERQRSYPRAVTCNGAERPEVAQVAAVRWIAERHLELGGTILLFVPRKSDLKEIDGHLARLAAHPAVAIGAWKGHIDGWSGGPVLAAWPSREKLGQIADDQRTYALCVIPWNTDETGAWEQAFQPERLAGAAPASEADTLDPVVVAGLTFQLAADIVSTTIAPSWLQIAQVAAIAVIRTFLSYCLDRDLEARVKEQEKAVA